MVAVNLWILMELSYLNLLKKTELFYIVLIHIVPVNKVLMKIHNRMLRRFFLKGTDFTHINQNVFLDIQNWMNHYPRKKLNGLKEILSVLW